MRSVPEALTKRHRNAVALMALPDALVPGQIDGTG